MGSDPSTLAGQTPPQNRRASMVVFIAKCKQCPYEWGATDESQFFLKLYKSPMCPNCKIFLEWEKKVNGLTNAAQSA
jgi:hypothetical protein